MSKSALSGVVIILNALLVRSAFSLELAGRQSSIQAVDPFDHTWIEQWASLGDSYSIGLGAGHAVKASDKVDLNPGGFFAGYCYQYSYGYANIMNSDDNLGVQPKRRFQYLGCSGAVASNVLKDQVPLLKSPQMVTLSVGGNDAGLATILNWCIYQWFAPSIWNNCDNVLRTSRDTTNSDTYIKDLTELIEAIKGKTQNASNRIYWIGYNKFFDTTTDDCDEVTWAIPRLLNKQYLTKNRRQSMNDLVDLVNTKIRAVINQAGPQVVFVDWAADVDAIKGRYCEPGVNETWDKGHGISENREETAFYEWGTTKDDDDSDDKSHDELRRRQDIHQAPNTAAGNATFEGAIANFLIQGKANDPATYANVQEDLGVNITGSFLPDSYGRIFHVTKYGNSIMAKNIINAITEQQAKLMNMPAITTTVGCHAAAATAKPTSSASPAPTNTLQCHDTANDKGGVARDEAVKAVKDFCGQTTSPKRYNQGIQNELTLTLKNTRDPTKGIKDAPDCESRFTAFVIDACDGNDANNLFNYKWGGTYTTIDNWQYDMGTAPNPTDADNCDVSWKVGADLFEIRGKNFPTSLGKDGSGLKAQLDGCGGASSITDWHFELTPEDTVYQWYAYGRTLVGQKTCIGHAVVTAGGSTTGNCHGAG